MAKGIPTIAGAKAIAGLYRDAGGSIWGDKGDSAFYYLILTLTWRLMMPSGRMLPG